jgi:Asp-tRNA(Asn)/Glu-tRNA(Gln) amidotransferase A subunit family amidase
LEGLQGWKIAFSMDLGYFEVDPEVQKNTLATIDVFKSLGCRVEEVDLGWHLGALDAFITYFEGLAAAVLGDLLPRWRFEMDPFLVGIVERGMRHTAARIYRALQARGAMYKTLAPILDEYNVLVCPTLAVPSVKADHACADPNFKINGKPIYPYIGWQMTYPFNMVAQCPAISVPSGFAASGVPTGLQIVGKTFDDASVFQAAAAFEAASPWRDRRPSI